MLNFVESISHIHHHEIMTLKHCSSARHEFTLPLCVCLSAHCSLLSRALSSMTPLWSFVNCSHNYSQHTFHFFHVWRLGGSVVQCSSCDLKVVSSILAHSSFLVRWVVLSLTLVYCYLVQGDYLITSLLYVQSLLRYYFSKAVTLIVDGLFLSIW